MLQDFQTSDAWTKRNSICFIIDIIFNIPLKMSYRIKICRSPNDCGLCPQEENIQSLVLLKQPRVAVLAEEDIDTMAKNLRLDAISCEAVVYYDSFSNRCTFLCIAMNQQIIIMQVVDPYSYNCKFKRLYLGNCVLERFSSYPRDISQKDVITPLGILLNEPNYTMLLRALLVSL